MTVNLEGNTTMVSLQCEARGATSYNWERQYGSIPSGATGINTNILTIFNLQIEDAGDYRCVATNDKGQRFSKYSRISINGTIILLLLVVQIDITCINNLASSSLKFERI